MLLSVAHKAHISRKAMYGESWNGGIIVATAGIRGFDSYEAIVIIDARKPK